MLWPPTKEMGGVLSLNFLPTPEEWRYCGLSYHILFGEGDSPYLEWIAATGAIVIPYCNHGNNEPWHDESHVGGYFLADDTPYDYDKVKGWYDKMKQKTSKPVGSIFWRPPNKTDEDRLVAISKFLDFILLYDYAYIRGYSLEKTNSYIAYMISVVKALNCPVMLGAQGFGDIGGFAPYIDPKEVGIRNQYQQYHAAGISVWWYSWTNEDADIKRNHQNLMHEFYGGEEKVKFTPIGTTTDRFFWAMKEFENKLFTGTYKLTGPKAYNYPPWTYLKTFAAGEALIEFEVLRNNLYVSTEEKGYIYRRNTPTDWVVVLDDAWDYCKPLRTFLDYMYCGLLPRTWDKSKILRTSNGTSWNQVAYFDRKICQGLIIYKNELYALCHNQSNNKAWASKTSDGINWSMVPALSDNLTGYWETGVVSGTNLFLGLNIETGASTKIYKYDRATLIEAFSTSQGVPHSCCLCNGEIYWLLGPNWKEPGSSYLFRSPSGEPGTWKLIKTFTGKPNARGITVCNNELYLGIQNIVYKMEGVVPPPPKFPCPHCPEVFPTQAELDAHIASEHPSDGEPVQAIFHSEAAYDGTVHDTRLVDVTGNYLEIKEYSPKKRGFVSFDTSEIPDNAVIDSAYIRVYLHDADSSGTAYIDYCLYGALTPDDFARVAEASNITTVSGATPVGWRNSGIFTNINKTGRSQYRLRKTTGSAYIVFRTANYGGGSHKPELHVTYHLPEPPEEITTHTIRHTCNALIEHRASSITGNNDALSCPHCGLSLGVQGIKGSEQVIEEPEVITRHIVICESCGSKLELSISSIASKNIQQYCPVCGAPAD